MPFSAWCSNCGKQYTLADTQAGKVLRCKVCGGMVHAPINPPPAAPGIHPASASLSGITAIPPIISRQATGAPIAPPISPPSSEDSLTIPPIAAAPPIVADTAVIPPPQHGPPPIATDHSPPRIAIPEPEPSPTDIPFAGPPPIADSAPPFNPPPIAEPSPIAEPPPVAMPPAPPANFVVAPIAAPPPPHTEPAADFALAPMALATDEVFEVAPSSMFPDEPRSDAQSAPTPREQLAPIPRAEALESIPFDWGYQKHAKPPPPPPAEQAIRHGEVFREPIQSTAPVDRPWREAYLESQIPFRALTWEVSNERVLASRSCFYLGVFALIAALLYGLIGFGMFPSIAASSGGAAGADGASPIHFPLLIVTGICILLGLTYIACGISIGNNGFLSAIIALVIVSLHALALLLILFIALLGLSDSVMATQAPWVYGEMAALAIWIISLGQLIYKLIRVLAAPARRRL